MSDPEPKAPSGADQFIDDVAHELRTPLATLAQLSEILADHLHEMSQEQVAQSLAALRRQAERASALVANLFDLSRLDGGRVQFSFGAVDAAAAAHRALGTAPPPSGTDVTISVPDGLSVRVDPVRFEQVLTHLLTNAYRYGGPQVSISASRAEGGVELAVSDNGSGVPADLARAGRQGRGRAASGAARCPGSVPGGAAPRPA